MAGFGAAAYPMFRSTEVSRGRDEWAAAIFLILLSVLAYRISSQLELRTRTMVLFGAGWGALMYVHPPAVLVLPAHMAILLLAHPQQRAASRQSAPRGWRAPSLRATWQDGARNRSREFEKKHSYARGRRA